jgi:hypothetical protein
MGRARIADVDSMAMTGGVEDAIDRFRALVLADAALQDALGGVADMPTFVARAAEAARARGVRLEAAELQAWLHSRPLTLGASATPAPVHAGPPLKGWLPIRVSQVPSQAMVDWAYFGDRPLTEPFFEEAAARALFQPFNLLFRFRTPLGGLARWSQGLPHRQPDGFIFHMSRCGSTLAAQMLAAWPANIVLSEGGPIDAVIRGDGADAARLRAMVGALGQGGGEGAGRYFIKLDCWHIRFLPLFRQAFPSTPWVFLYRDPAEVLVSQMRRRGVQMVPQMVPPAVFGLEAPPGAPAEDYCASVLGAICQAALDAWPAGGGRLVNYSQLPQALWTTILPHFGIEAADAERAAMARAACYDAKAPQTAFTPDAEAKQQAVTPAIRAAVDRQAAEAYRRLEALRLTATAPGPRR